MVYGNGPCTYLRKVESPNEVLVVKRNAHAVTVASPSPSGSYCAAGDQDGNVIIFALDNEDKTLVLEKKVVSGRINDIAWSGDNERVVAVGEGKDGFAAAFAAKGGNTVGDMAGHSRTVNCCDFRKDRPFRIASGGQDFVLNWYEGPPFKFKKAHKGENDVNAVRFSPDGSLMVAAGKDKKILVYDGKTGEPAGELPCDHKGSIYQLAFSPDSKFLLSSAADKTVKLWDMGAKSLVQTFTLADSTIEYMQVGCVYSNEHMLSLSLNGDVNLFKQGEDKPVTVLRGHQKKITQIVPHPSGAVATISADPSVLIWPKGLSDSATSIRPKGKKVHTEGLLAGAAWIGDNLITGGSDGSIGVSKLADGTFELAGKLGGVFGMAAVDGAAFVATSKGIVVLDQSGAEKGKLEVGYTPVVIASSPQTKLVAIGAKEKKVTVYAAKEASLEPVGEIPLDAAASGLGFSACGTKLAVAAGKQLGVYDPASQDKLDTGVEGSFHTTTIQTVSFNPSGSMLLSAGGDAQIIIWSLEAKKKLEAKPNAHQNGVTASLWLGDDEFVTSGQDAAIRSWKL